MNEQRSTSHPSVTELFEKLEKLGVCREEVDAHLQERDAERAREAAAPVVTDDSLGSIAAKLDKLQESVDAIAAKLDKD
jgi:hypothetical protein